MTNERIAAFDAIGFIWTSQEYVTRSFDERIEEHEEHKQMRSRQREDTRRQQPQSILCAGQARTKKGREGWLEKADRRAYIEA